MEINEVFKVLSLMIVFSILIQFLVNRLKAILSAKIMKYLPADVMAALLGIVFAIMFKVDVFTYLGLTSSLPYVGYVVSGLIISAGAPAVHELLLSVREQRKLLEDSLINKKEGGF